MREMAVALAGLVLASAAVRSINGTLAGERHSDGALSARGEVLAVRAASPRSSCGAAEPYCPRAVRPAGRSCLMRAPEGARQYQGLRSWTPLVLWGRPPSLRSSREEDCHGAVRWTGRPGRELHTGRDGAVGQATELDGGGDQRPGVGGGGAEHPRAHPFVPGGGD